MAKNDKNVSLNSKEVFKEFNISELEDKLIILSAEEQIELYNALLSSKSTPLLEIVKLPYNYFVPKYYLEFYSKGLKALQRDAIINQLIGYEKMSSNSEIGIKFYLMPEPCVKVLDAMIKNPNIKFGDVLNYFRTTNVNTKSMSEYFNMSIDEILRRANNSGFINGKLKKIIHIMQYVDAEEAKKLRLNSFTFYTNGEYRGFGLQEKLDSMNSLSKHVLIEYLALNGNTYKTSQEISSELKVNNSFLRFLLNTDFLSLLTRSVGEVRNKLGYLGKNSETNRVSYKSKSQFASDEAKLESIYTLKHLSEEEQAQLGAYYSKKAASKADPKFPEIDEILKRVK